VADAPVRSRRSWPVVAVAVLAGVVLFAWVLQVSVSGGDESSQGDSPPPYGVKVTRGDEVLKVYDLVALRSLPQERVVIDGKEQTGPALATVLADAGAERYDSVVVRGAGLRDKGSLTLTRAQIGRVQFDFSDRGTVKVCGPELYHAEWVRDVLAIDVR